MRSSTAAAMGPVQSLACLSRLGTRSQEHCVTSTTSLGLGQASPMLTASMHAMSTPTGSKGAAVTVASTRALAAASAYCSTSSRESDASGPQESRSGIGASRRWRYGCACARGQSRYRVGRLFFLRLWRRRMQTRGPARTAGPWPSGPPSFGSCGSAPAYISTSSSAPSIISSMSGRSPRSTSMSGACASTSSRSCSASMPMTTALSATCSPRPAASSSSGAISARTSSPRPATSEESPSRKSASSSMLVSSRSPPSISSTPFQASSATSP
mmetsp:Transcript_31974/g.101800  ORF Transcript_31974/g.101800 Transcript_31974/m.101800 type:complete len:271 (-) Transcript_31974:212-1024(-)